MLEASHLNIYRPRIYIYINFCSILHCLHFSRLAFSCLFYFLKGHSLLKSLQLIFTWNNLIFKYNGVLKFFFFLTFWGTHGGWSWQLGHLTHELSLFQIPPTMLLFLFHPFWFSVLHTVFTTFTAFLLNVRRPPFVLLYLHTSPLVISPTSTTSVITTNNLVHGILEHPKS